MVAAALTRISSRRAAAIVGIALAVFGGVIVFRGGDVKSFLHFAGIGHKEKQTGVETYVQRTMLVYYGWRVFVDHPVARRRLGGVERRGDVYGPLLPLLHRRFPSTPRSASRRPRTPTASRTPTSRRSPTSASSASCCSSPRCSSPLWLAVRRLLRGPPAESLLLPADVAARRDGRADRDRPRRRHPDRRAPLDRSRPVAAPAPPLGEHGD